MLQRDMDTYSGLYDEGLAVRLQSGKLVSGGELGDVIRAVAEALEQAAREQAEQLARALQSLFD